MMPKKFAQGLFRAHYRRVIHDASDDEKTAALSTMAIKRRLLKFGVDINSTAVQASSKNELRHILHEAAKSCELQQLEKLNLSDHEGDHGSFFGDDERASDKYEAYLTRIGCMGRHDHPVMLGALVVDVLPGKVSAELCLGAPASLGVEPLGAKVSAGKDGFPVVTKEELFLVEAGDEEPDSSSSLDLPDDKHNHHGVLSRPRVPTTDMDLAPFSPGHGFPSESTGRWQRARQRREGNV